MALPNAQLLIGTGALEAELGDPTLRIFDCSVILEPAADGVTIASGRDGWAAAHIPGSDFLDLLTELSDPASPYHFMLPPAEQFAEVMSEHGVEDGTRVVLYDSRGSMWAARVWWMLRAYGFDAAAVLDGGWTKWALEGRPVDSAPASYPPGRFQSRPRPGVFVDRNAVLAGLGDPATCLINGLGEEQHAGSGGTVQGGRPGRIPGSGNVPAASLVDPETQAYLPEAELRARLESAGATTAGRVIAYCGGGIAASSVAFALRLLGCENTAIYDASLEEWATDPSFPIEVG